MIKEKDKLGTLDTWINPEVISNIISITKIEKSGYCITYDTKEEWVVYNQEGETSTSIVTLENTKGFPIWN